MTYLTRILTSFAVVGAMSLFGAGTGLGPDGAWAQTATNLKCKRCVGARQLKKGAIKSNRLKDGAVTLGKMESGLGERANTTQPYYVTMDTNNERRTIVTNGPITLSVGCFLNEPDGIGGFRDAIRLFASSSVAGWFTFNNPNGIGNNGPFTAGQEVEMDLDTISPPGTLDVDSESTGDGIVAPDGSIVSFADDSNLVAHNALGHRCTHAGVVSVVTGTP